MKKTSILGKKNFSVATEIWGISYVGSRNESFDREYFSGRPINFKALRTMFAARYFRYYKSLIKKFVMT